MPHTSKLELVNVSDIAAASAVVDGNVLDLLATSEIVVLHLFATINLGTTLDVLVEESIDGTNWIASGIVFTQLTANGSEKVVCRGDDITARYIRAKRTSTGDGWDYKILVGTNTIGR